MLLISVRPSELKESSMKEYPPGYVNIAMNVATTKMIPPSIPKYAPILFHDGDILTTSRYLRIEYLPLPELPNKPVRKPIFLSFRVPPLEGHVSGLSLHYSLEAIP